MLWSDCREGRGRWEIDSERLVVAKKMLRGWESVGEAGWEAMFVACGRLMEGEVGVEGELKFP